MGTLALVTGCSLLPFAGPARDAEGAITARAGTDAFSIEVGDCIDDPGEGTVSGITVLPCKELHDLEAFAGTEMPDGDYPGVVAAAAAAHDFCSAEFLPYVGVEYDESGLDLLYFYPVEETWESAGDREILCFVGDAAGTPVSGTLEDVGR